MVYAMLFGFLYYNRKSTCVGLAWMTWGGWTGVDDLGWMDWRERLGVDRLAWLR